MWISTEATYRDVIESQGVQKSLFIACLQQVDTILSSKVLTVFGELAPMNLFALGNWWCMILILIVTTVEFAYPFSVHRTLHRIP